jgi:hypothetical protein
MNVSKWHDAIQGITKMNMHLRGVIIKQKTQIHG